MFKFVIATTSRSNEGQRKAISTIFLPHFGQETEEYLWINIFNNHSVLLSLPFYPILNTTILHQIEFIVKLSWQFINVLNEVLQVLQLYNVGTQFLSNLNNPLS
ncbi:Hypothetical protein SSO0800 [Saccharolobus solfataricus P2]|uniref:Uncharacterized protein n=2 Tax=Saccharolobus solfataricus TaxID=2287 RepID=Q7LXH3_SACS2|nr:Hypothetical protein SSO0800 [Saccharolobus solfataricus P2]CAB57503.1 hypothetical protein [Saccharolobus solfataricus P2]SAI84384.1 uncharacterised protein [Saccharolobus solfataricus]